MINIVKLYNRPRNFARLTGVSIDLFKEIVEKIRPKWEALQKKKKCHGRNSRLKSLEYEVLLVLFYYRTYTNFWYIGTFFDLDASNVCRHIKRIEPVNLAKFRGLLYSFTMFIIAILLDFS